MSMSSMSEHLLLFSNTKKYAVWMLGHSSSIIFYLYYQNKSPLVLAHYEISKTEKTISPEMPLI